MTNEHLTVLEDNCCATLKTPVSTIDARQECVEAGTTMFEEKLAALFGSAPSDSTVGIRISGHVRQLSKTNLLDEWAMSKPSKRGELEQGIDRALHSRKPSGKKIRCSDFVAN